MADCCGGNVIFSIRRWCVRGCSFIGGMYYNQRSIELRGSSSTYLQEVVSSYTVCLDPPLPPSQRQIMCICLHVLALRTVGLFGAFIPTSRHNLQAYIYAVGYLAGSRVAGALYSENGMLSVVRPKKRGAGGASPLGKKLRSPWFRDFLSFLSSCIDHLLSGALEKATFEGVSRACIQRS